MAVGRSFEPADGELWFTSTEGLESLEDLGRPRLFLYHGARPSISAQWVKNRIGAVNRARLIPNLF